MRSRRCPYWLLTALWVGVLGAGGQELAAQNSLPQTIIQAQAELTAQEQGTVDDFLNAQVARLQSSDPAEVAEARARIVEPVSLSNSSYFLGYYLPAVAGRITPLVQPSEPLMTRLNVAIIGAKLTGQELVDLLQASANDASPAVRYWIAKSVGAAAKAGAFDPQQQQAVLNVLAAHLKAEDSSLVLEQVLLAIAEIQLPDAITTVLEGLDQRIVFHKDNPAARFKPIQNGMQQLWSKLIALRTSGTNVTKDLYELARIAYRYYALIADQMPAFEQADNDEDEQIKQDKALMAQRCVQVMVYVVKDVANQTAPRPVNTQVAAELQASRDLWREILKGPPFNFTEDQLSLEDAAPAE